MHEANAINELESVVGKIEKNDIAAHSTIIDKVFKLLKHVSIPVKYVYMRRLYLRDEFRPDIDGNRDNMLSEIAQWKGMRL